MRCSSCKFENAAGKKFNGKRCRARPAAARSVAVKTPPEASFCKDCGASSSSGSGNRWSVNPHPGSLHSLKRPPL